MVHTFVSFVCSAPAVPWHLQVTTKQGVSNVLAGTQPEGPRQVLLLELIICMSVEISGLVHLAVE
jgi:hypothetical protein